MPKEYLCEAVTDTLPAPEGQTEIGDIHINCTKQAVKIVACFSGEDCIFYPRKHNHAFCLEHYDIWKAWAIAKREQETQKGPYRA